MLLREDRIDVESFRELERRVQDLTTQVERQAVSLENILQTTTDNNLVPALVNLLNNTDNIYSDSAYSGSTYTDSEDVLAEWYGRAQADVDSWSENSSSVESSDSIRRSAHGSGARTGVEWSDSLGAILLTGGYKIASKFPIKYAGKGNYIAVRMQLKSMTGGVIEPTIRCRVSVWDNSDNRIIRGTKPALTSTKIGAHTGGAVTREYVLEIEMPDGRKFYSDLSVPDSETNTVSAVDVNNTNAVSVSWSDIIGNGTYRVYRRTPLEADTTWYKIADITNGSNLCVDYGGAGFGTWTPPSFNDIHREYQTAEASFLNVGELLQDTSVHEITLAFYMPSLFSINGDQFVQVEFFKEDQTDTTTTEIPADELFIDRIGVSYTNGRWCPSPRDLAIVAVPTGTPDPPATGGGTGGNPSSGEGDETTMERQVPIYE